MMRILLRALFAITILSLAQAQDPGPLQADRPDQTESPSVVPLGRIQIESGFSYQRATSASSSSSHPAVLCKYGINGSIELRLDWELASLKMGQSSFSGFSPVAVGFKANILQESGMIPTTSFLGHVALPRVASTNFQSKYYAPSFRFAMQHTLSDESSLGYNLGAEWDGETAKAAYIYTLVYGGSLNEALGYYVEVYGTTARSELPQHLADTGMTYLLQQNMLLDISGGVGISSTAPDYFLALGFSVRLPD